MKVDVKGTEGLSGGSITAARLAVPQFVSTLVLYASFYTEPDDDETVELALPAEYLWPAIVFFMKLDAAGGQATPESISGFDQVAELISWPEDFDGELLNLSGWSLAWCDSEGREYDCEIKVDDEN